MHCLPLPFTAFPRVFHCLPGSGVRLGTGSGSRYTRRYWRRCRHVTCPATHCTPPSLHTSLIYAPTSAHLPLAAHLPPICPFFLCPFQKAHRNPYLPSDARVSGPAADAFPCSCTALQCPFCSFTAFQCRSLPFLAFALQKYLPVPPAAKAAGGAAAGAGAVVPASLFPGGPSICLRPRPADVAASAATAGGEGEGPAAAAVPEGDGAAGAAAAPLVLVPGAALGRLAVDIGSQGYRKILPLACVSTCLRGKNGNNSACPCRSQACRPVSTPRRWRRWRPACSSTARSGRCDDHLSLSIHCLFTAFPCSSTAFHCRSLCFHCLSGVASAPVRPW